jgi:SAM-dependent methyltransferase/esterase/lipase
MRISSAANEPNPAVELVASSSNFGVKFRTETLTVMNSAGKKIRAYLDVPIDSEKRRGVVIIAPAYGETKENNLLISAHFAANDYCGLRFDWTDHVGESDGDIFASSLSKMRADLKTLVDYVEKKSYGRQIGVVASSLAARVALKMVANDTRPDFLVCLSPVVNLRSTLEMVYREDLVGMFTIGKRYGTLNILGFPIDADHFLNDSIQGSFSDISSAGADATRIKTATFFVIGQRDSWVRTSDVQLVFGMINAQAKDVLVLPKMLHRILEDPSSGRGALRTTVKFIIGAVTADGHKPDVISIPCESQIRARETQEKEHLKGVYVYSKSEERHFWKEYLSNFQYIINIHDFYNLLECVYNLLGGAWPGQKILDAGCGIGNYGLFLLTKQLYRVQQDLQILTRPPIRYFGIDFVQAAMNEAKLRITELAEDYRKNRSTTHGSYCLVESNFVLGDLDTEIPYLSGLFDQICCNLVLSYLQEPKLALREFWRVLRPGGKMVVTSLKPGADLSEIYRNFISVAESPRELEEGRRLLSNAGMIKIKEIRGLYHFYTEKDLRDAVREAGFVKPRTLRSFGDQANVIVCSKV